jgi:hypothetical protein
MCLTDPPLQEPQRIQVSFLRSVGSYSAGALPCVPASTLIQLATTKLSWVMYSSCMCTAFYLLAGSVPCALLTRLLQRYQDQACCFNDDIQVSQCRLCLPSPEPLTQPPWATAQQCALNSLCLFAVTTSFCWCVTFSHRAPPPSPWPPSWQQSMQQGPPWVTNASCSLEQVRMLSRFGLRRLLVCTLHA